MAQDATVHYLKHAKSALIIVERKMEGTREVILKTNGTAMYILLGYTLVMFLPQQRVYMTVQQ